MKFKIKVITIFLILSFKLLGQSIADNKFEFGVVGGFVFTNTQRFERPLATNYSFGIYTKYQINRRIGVNVGVDFQRQNMNTTYWKNCDPLGHLFFCIAPGQDKFETIKFPVLLNLNLNYKTNPKLKINLIGGYEYGKLLNAKEKEEDYRLNGLIDDLHFGVIGLEFQKRVIGDVKLTLGGHLELTSIYSLRYGDIQNIKIILRIGK